MPPSERYNGPADPPLLAYVAKYRYKGVFKDDTHNLETVRDYYDKIGTKYGFEYKLSYGFRVRLDYYPISIDDLWELALTLYHKNTEIARIKDVVVSEDGNHLEIYLNLGVISLDYPYIIKRVESIRKTEEENDRRDAEDAAEEAFRRSLGASSI